MQLRKVCSHPFLFDWPIDPKTQQPVLGAELVNASGKMMVLDRLLCELLRRGHRVLVFSQFVTMLNIIEVATVITAYYCLDLIRMRRTGLPISWAGRSVVLMARLPRRNGGSRWIYSNQQRRARPRSFYWAQELVGWASTWLLRTRLFSMTRTGYTACWFTPWSDRELMYDFVWLV